MPEVLRGAAPLQILKPIVGFDAISMVNLEAF
jgi:hypothetical protein